MKAGGGGGSSGSGRRGSTVPEGTMSHAAKFLQDNPTMRKSLHRNQNHEVNDPRRTRSLDPGSSSSSSSTPKLWPQTQCPPEMTSSFSSRLAVGAVVVLDK
mmetsp:Transcript_21091/g.35502  ORF Transcript_21091/g.35502 Transcript_21091/m.35502 type:complete len:101 (-) Transcript_21091:446-748(-)